MSISREVLAAYVKPGCTLIETGTRWGDTCIRAIELGASLVYTVEVEAYQANIAELHIGDALRENSKKVTVYNEKSVAFLGRAFLVGEPLILFLDAHTGVDSPVLEELAVVATWAVKPDYILVDDLRCMSGWGISEKQLRDAISLCGSYMFSYERGVEPNDILVAERRRAP